MIQYCHRLLVCIILLCLFKLLLPLYHLAVPLTEIFILRWPVANKRNFLLLLLLLLLILMLLLLLLPLFLLLIFFVIFLLLLLLLVLVLFCPCCSSRWRMHGWCAARSWASATGSITAARISDICSTLATPHSGKLAGLCLARHPLAPV